MNMPHTENDALVELHNSVMLRIVEAKASKLYWRNIARKSKTNSPEIVEALNKVKINEDNVKQDIEYLKCIDSLLKGKNDK